MQKINIKRLVYRLKHDIFTTNNMVIGIACLIALGWASGSISVLERNYKLQREIDAKRRQLKLAELEVLTLHYEKDYYKSDEYKELAVRQRLGRALPGETALILPPNTEMQSDTTSKRRTNQPGAEATSNTEQWLRFLTGSDAVNLQE